MPLAHLNSWVLEHRDENEFRSRFGGAFGVSWFLKEWSEDDRAALRTAIEEYKRVRPLLSGRRYLLSGPIHQTWDIWQFESEDGAESVVLGFRDGGQIEELRVIPHVSDPEANYRVTLGFDGAGYDVEGVDLASRGLSLMIQHPRESQLVSITRLAPVQ